MMTSGAAAAAWVRVIHIAACLVGDAGVVAAADETLPNVNHFVLLTPDDPSGVTDLTRDDFDTSRKARPVISHTAASNGDVAAFYADRG